MGDRVRLADTELLIEIEKDHVHEQVRAGACGLKIHEDWGTTPAVIDECLAVADAMDIQVAIHTDSLNEAGYVDDTIRSIKGRAIHSNHTEGAGGGHTPILSRSPARPKSPFQLNPTRPETLNTIDEHLDMLMVRRLSRKSPRMSHSPKAGSGPNHRGRGCVP